MALNFDVDLAIECLDTGVLKCKQLATYGTG
jgi:hypothetical protein